MAEEKTEISEDGSEETEQTEGWIKTVEDFTAEDYRRHIAETSTCENAPTLVNKDLLDRLPTFICKSSESLSNTPSDQVVILDREGNLPDGYYTIDLAEKTRYFLRKKKRNDHE